VIHNAAIRAAGIDAVYLALHADTGNVAGLIHGLAHAGGGGNVTVPHKGVAADSVDKASAAVKATHACNTFWLQRGKVYGENTDVVGFREAVADVISDVQGTRALVIGAGGAARSVLHALLEDKASGVTVLGRTPGRAREIAEVAGRRSKRVRYITSTKLLAAEGFDLIVNATSLGLKDADALPLQFSAVGGLTAAFDVVYRPGGTRWIAIARATGIPSADGSEMLIRQAAAAFELWFDVEAPIAAMRRAFNSQITQI
jgi:shikimate dehydrogenase